MNGYLSKQPTKDDIEGDLFPLYPMEVKAISKLNHNTLFISSSYYITPLLGDVFQKNRRSSTVRRMRRRLMGLYHDETFNLLEMRVSSWKRNANLPTLDGLFGGKACFREWADESMW